MPRTKKQDAVKRDRFVRIAEMRTQKVLDDLTALSKCAAPESYVYTQKDVEKILGAIEAQVQAVRDRFAGAKKFTLSSALVPESPDAQMKKDPSKYAILVERDYKGEYERFALTPDEFRKTYLQDDSEKNGLQEDNSGTFTIQPLVHIWYQKTQIGSDLWNQFFSDMSWGLPESDIVNGNLASIREDFMESLKDKLPFTAQKEVVSEPPAISEDELNAMRGNLCNLRHELDGMAGYDHPDHFVSYVELQYFKGECQLCAAECGVRLTEEQMGKLETMFSDPESSKLFEESGSYEEFLEAIGYLPNRSFDNRTHFTQCMPIDQQIRAAAAQINNSFNSPHSQNNTIDHEH